MRVGTQLGEPESSCIASRNDAEVAYYMSTSLRQRNENVVRLDQVI